MKNLSIEQNLICKMRIPDLKKHCNDHAPLITEHMILREDELFASCLDTMHKISL